MHLALSKILYRILLLRGLFSSINPYSKCRRILFCQWFLRQSFNPRFHMLVLFMDETKFLKDSIMRNHSSLQWTKETLMFLQKVICNILADIFSNYLIGRKYSPHTLITEEVFWSCPAGTNRQHFTNHSPWGFFMQDSSATHFIFDAREYLDDSFINCWVGRVTYKLFWLQPHRRFLSWPFSRYFVWYTISHIRRPPKLCNSRLSSFMEYNFNPMNTSVYCQTTWV